MQYVVIICLFFLACHPSSESQPDPITEKGFDVSAFQTSRLGASGGTTRPCAVTPAPDAGLYVIGNATAALGGETQHGTRDFFVARYRADGSLWWVRQLGDLGVSWGIMLEGCALTADRDGTLYVAGTINGRPSFEGTPLPSLFTGFVASWDALGQRRFLRLIGSTDGNTEAMAIARRGANEVLVLGYTRASLGGTKAGYGDVFLAQYTTDGLGGDITRFGGADEDIPSGLIVADDRAWIAWRTTDGIAGRALSQTLATLDADNKIVARREIPPAELLINTLHPNSPQGACFVGNSRNGAAIPYRLECLDRDLKTRWAAPQESTGSISIERLVCAMDVCLLVGSTVDDLDGVRIHGELDGAAVLLDRQGRRWTRLFGAPGALTRGTTGVLAADGAALVLGWSNGAIGGVVPMGPYDGWSAKAP